MSTRDRQALEPKNPYSPGATAHPASLFMGIAPKSTMTWDMADAELLQRAVTEWCAGGHAITFGVTSDGGALSISLLAGGKPYKVYASSPDELNELLSRIGQTKNVP